jgi:MYXO-CTERM domain-containing protein
MLLLGFLCATSTVAKADLYNATLTIGNLVGHPNESVNDITGLTLTGTITLVGDIITAVDLTRSYSPILTGDPDTFTRLDGQYIVTTGIFAEYGLFDYSGITPAGGSVGPTSEITILSNEYLVSGSLTPAVTPEPGYYAVLGLGMAGLAFAAWRRRRQA